MAEKTGQSTPLRFKMSTTASAETRGDQPGIGDQKDPFHSQRRRLVADHRKGARSEHHAGGELEPKLNLIHRCSFANERPDGTLVMSPSAGTRSRPYAGHSAGAGSTSVN